MASYNSITLLGNVGQEPKINTAGEHRVAEFTLATNSGTGDKARVDWHRIKAWNAKADIAKNYIHKGTTIMVVGSLQYRTFEGDSGRVTIAEIVADNITLLGKKDQERNAEQRNGQRARQTTDLGRAAGFNEEKEDLPF